MIEPAVARDAPEAASPSKIQPQAPYFEDTHFPVNHTLSEAFGSFLGNENATYIMVAIRKAAQYQQQVSTHTELAVSLPTVLFVGQLTHSRLTSQCFARLSGDPVSFVCVQSKRHPERV